MGRKRRLWIGLLAAGAVLIAPARAWAYLDPGTQTQIVNMLLPMLGMLGAFIVAMLWPFRMCLQWLTRKFGRRAAWAAFIGACVLILGGGGGAAAWLVLGGGDNTTEEVPTVSWANYEKFERVIVLGIDGLDPTVMEEMMDNGELPQFSRLRSSGTYSRLETTLPPESPVAWSGLATGCNPGKHGIFDFLHRDPSTYRPILSIYKVNTRNLLDKRDRRYLPIRHAEGFWSIASRAGVPSTVIRWPAAFPPEKVTGRFLSGLGIPDVCGRFGRYSLFTTEGQEPAVFKGRWCAGSWRGKTFQSKLAGPVVAGIMGRKEATLDVLVKRLADDRISLKIGSSDETELGVGKWSGYIPIRFKAGLGKTVPAQVRAYLAALSPALRLYVSTPQVDPADPYFPITWPDEYAAELAKAIGRYTTLGMAEDVDAMKDGALPPEAFEQAVLAVYQERKRQFDYELARFDKGLFAFVFDDSDRIQHMFWRTRDPDHPIYDAQFARDFGHVIPDMYKRMDGVLGEVLAKADEKTAVLVVSDHGFNTFRTSVGLNSWLVENGYMVLTTPDGRNGRELFADVDWSRTKAYSVGFTSIYVNLKGREKHGIIEAGAAHRALCDELVTKLRDLADPVSGQKAIRNVYLGAEAYRGARAAGAPDLIVGFNGGFRAENVNVLGGAPATVFADNKDLWCGDHLMDPGVVPGVLFSNCKLSGDRPRNIDLAPTVLQLFGIARTETMDGQPLLDIRE